jgi:hypothetical protein
MRKLLRDNSLSLVTLGLFGLCWLGHSLAGYYAYYDDQRAHQQPPLRYTAYLTSSHLWASVFENWESEFFAVGTVVVLSIWLRERGSPESKPVHSAHAETGQ